MGSDQCSLRAVALSFASLSASFVSQSLAKRTTSADVDKEKPAVTVVTGASDPTAPLFRKCGAPLTPSPLCHSRTQNTLIIPHIRLPLTNQRDTAETMPATDTRYRHHMTVCYLLGSAGARARRGSGGSSTAGVWGIEHGGGLGDRVRRGVWGIEYGEGLGD